MGIIKDRLAALAIDAARDFIRERRAQRAGTPVTAPLSPAEEAEARDIAENESNNEPLAESRTFVGGLLGFMVSAGALVAEIQSADGFDFETGGPLVATTLGALIVMIGRAKEGLASIDWRRPWTLFGIGK